MTLYKSFFQIIYFRAIRWVSDDDIEAALKLRSERFLDGYAFGIFYIERWQIMLFPVVED